MKYKVRDKVKIREDLKADNHYGTQIFVEDMKKYAGKIMTVKACVFAGEYLLEEDNDRWIWTDEMLEGVEGINILVDGNKVIAKKGDKVGIARCSPEDEFDIFIGVKLALSRLEEECKPYNWLKDEVTYYFPNVEKEDLYDCFQYASDEIDERMISRGIVFKTKEEAIECAKKMLEVVK